MKNLEIQSTFLCHLFNKLYLENTILAQPVKNQITFLLPTHYRYGFTMNTALQKGVTVMDRNVSAVVQH